MKIEDVIRYMHDAAKNWLQTREMSLEFYAGVLNSKFDNKYKKEK